MAIVTPLRASSEVEGFLVWHSMTEDFSLQANLAVPPNARGYKLNGKPATAKEWHAFYRLLMRAATNPKGRKRPLPLNKENVTGEEWALLRKLAGLDSHVKAKRGGGNGKAG